jgi:hypothetical protein
LRGARLVVLASPPNFRRGRVRVIGYANRPSKEAPFRDAGADIVITTMGGIASALAERSSV